MFFGVPLAFASALAAFFEYVAPVASGAPGATYRVGTHERKALSDSRDMPIASLMLHAKICRGHPAATPGHCGPWSDLSPGAKSQSGLTDSGIVSLISSNRSCSAC